MKTKDFDYPLPKELIAQTPLKDRLKSRLLVMDRFDGHIQHEAFEHFHRYLKKGDCLVLNNTKVLPARLIGTKVDTDASIEVLLLSSERLDVWEVLVKKAKKVKEGTVLSFGDGRLKMRCLRVKPDGLRDMELIYDGVLYEILNTLGHMPLPPYIHEKLEDKDRYQTVYSKEKGSAAAPTAGLHFTKSYLEYLRDQGIEIVYITLHVGLGTFRPVAVEDVTTHQMHKEYYHIDQKAAQQINAAKAQNRRVIAVGTTTVRTLETAQNAGLIQAGSGHSSLFIYPGFKFRIIDALLTNFHLPQSTLLMLVSAFSRKDYILKAYKEAVKQRYRFFSFGDAMFLTNLRK